MCSTILSLLWFQNIMFGQLHMSLYLPARLLVLHQLDKSTARRHLKSPGHYPADPYTSPIKAMAKVKLDGH